MADAPTPIKALSVLYFIIGAFTLLGGILLLLGGGALAALVQDAIGFEIAGGILIGVGAVLIIIGLLEGAAGVGLWQLKRWGRTLALVLSGIGLAMSLLALLTGDITQLLWAIVHGAILWYLTRPAVAALFRA